MWPPAAAGPPRMPPPLLLALVCHTLRGGGIIATARVAPPEYAGSFTVQTVAQAHPFIVQKEEQQQRQGSGSGGGDGGSPRGLGPLKGDDAISSAWKAFPRQDAVYSRATPGGDREGTVYLETVSSSAACMATLERHGRAVHGGGSGGSGTGDTAAVQRFYSGTWFATNYTKHGRQSPFAGQCFGVTSSGWRPYCCERGVVSFRGPETEPPPPPLPPPPPAPPSPCDSDAACSWNGRCSDGVCKCSPAWRGSRCSSLHLLPANFSGTGYHPTKSNRSISSWGGAVLHIGDTFYMFASEMVRRGTKRHPCNQPHAEDLCSAQTRSLHRWVTVESTLGRRTRR